MLVAELAQNVRLERQMASNPAAPFGIEFRHVENLHGDLLERRCEAAYAPRARSRGPRFQGRDIAANQQSETPFAALSARHGRPLEGCDPQRFHANPLRQRCSVSDTVPVPRIASVWSPSHSHRPSRPRRDSGRACPRDHRAPEHSAQDLPRCAHPDAAGVAGSTTRAAGTSTSSSPRRRRCSSSSACGSARCAGSRCSASTRPTSRPPTTCSSPSASPSSVG